MPSPVRDSSDSIIDWTSRISACRDARTKAKSEAVSFDDIRDEFLVHFPEVAIALQSYASSLLLALLPVLDGSSETEVEDENSAAYGKRKSQIVEVRNALRFASQCIALAGSASNSSTSSATGETSAISRAQNEAVLKCSVHKALAQVLMCRNTDGKSRVLAARLLSNLVTSNKQTGQAVLDDIALSPSDMYRTKTLMKTLGLSDVVDRETALSNRELNWVDMITVAARAGSTGREAMAALVAALFNSMIAVEDINESNGTDVRECVTTIPTLISQDSALMCALIRHILPAETITCKTHGPEDENQVIESTGDDATEWISLLLAKISGHGLFRNMYESVGVNGGKDSEEMLLTIAPEQLVLLHCISHSLDEWANDISQTAGSCPLGGKYGTKGILKSCLYLVDQIELLRLPVASLMANTEAYAGEKECRLSSYVTILEMLATILSSDDSSKTKDHVFIRLYLGKETSLLKGAVLELGLIVDKMSLENRGAKNRELHIKTNDQRLVVALVRLIGNLSYKCTSNQDLVRETLVPFDDNKTDTVSIQEISEDGTDVVVKRSGLHILLSCTSFSYACFTLREWALVAIRNVLDENMENQEVVAQLEAQKAVDNPELNRMGIKTVLDEHGKVRVEPKC